MIEGPVRAVDWVTMVAVGSDGDHSTWSRLLPRADEQAASAFAACSLE